MSGWKGVAAVLGGMAAIATIHALLVVPSILGQAADASSKSIRQALDSHKETVHEKAVTYREFKALGDDIKSRLTRIEDKLDKEKR